MRNKPLNERKVQTGERLWVYKINRTFRRLTPFKKFLLFDKDGGGGPWDSHRAEYAALS